MPPVPVAPRPFVPPGFNPNVPRPVPLAPFGTGTARDDSRTAADSILDTLHKAQRDADLRNFWDKHVADPDSFPQWVLDKLKDWLSKDHTPWVGENPYGKGGKEIQPEKKGTGQPGQNPTARYGWILRAYVYSEFQDNPTGGSNWGTWEGETTGVCNIGVSGNGTTSLRVYVGGELVIQGSPYVSFFYSQKSFYIYRKDGTSEANDRDQDPNKPPDKPPINQEPYGPIDTRGTKPPKSPESDKDFPPTKPLPKGRDPLPFPPPIWDGPPITNPGVPPIPTWDDPGQKGSGGNQNPQPAPTSAPTRSPNSPEPSGGGGKPSPDGGGGGGDGGGKTKKVKRKSTFYNALDGITYVVTEYDDGSLVVSAPIPPNAPGSTLTQDGINAATNNHKGIRQTPNPGTTPTQDPVRSPIPIERPTPTQKDEPKTTPIIENGPITIEWPDPTQDPTPIERPKPPKPDPVFQSLPTVTPKPTPNPNPTPDQNPSPPEENPTPFPPIVNLEKTSPPVVNPTPLPPITDGLRADPVTGKPVSPDPAPEKPKQQPPVNNPGNGGSSCQWPADRQIVIGGHGNTQKAVGAVDLLISGTTNKAVDAVAKDVTKVVDAVGTPAVGKASTLFNAIDNVSTFTEKFAKATRLDKVYNALTLFMVIHNASQLARNLGSSLDELINTGLQAIGIRDEKDEELSVSGAIGKSVESFIRSIIGNDVYDGVSLAWKKGSAIYSASVNIADAITSPLAGLASGLTEVGNNTGKIGNALVKSGTVLENSYDKMSENVQVSTGKLAQLNNYIQSGDTAVELVDSFTELARVPLETKESFDNVKEELDGLKTKMNEEVATKKTEDATAKNASQSPDILDLDVFKNLF